MRGFMVHKFYFIILLTEFFCLPGLLFENQISHNFETVLQIFNIKDKLTIDLELMFIFPLEQPSVQFEDMIVLSCNIGNNDLNNKGFNEGFDEG